MSGYDFLEPDIAAWYRATLIADATFVGMIPDGVNGVFTGDPVQGAATPYVVIQLQGTEGVLRIVGPTVFWESFLHVVKAVGKPEQFATLKAIMRRAVTLLDVQQNQVQGDARIVSCEYERALRLPADTYYGTLATQLGGFFRTYGQTAA